MPLVEPVDELKSEVTSSKPRDEKGKFIKIPDVLPSKNVLENFLLSHTGNYKNQDDILDIKIGNPLGRIVKLLEEIKRQKAFSFTLKGSLGIAGVVLTLSLFGLFGGSQILCNKGIQTHVGEVKSLNYKEIIEKQVPIISFLIGLTSSPSKSIKNRVVLVKYDFSTLYLPYSENIDLEKYTGKSVVATGNFNSCTNTLTINDANAIEDFVR